MLKSFDSLYQTLIKEQTEKKPAAKEEKKSVADSPEFAKALDDFESLCKKISKQHHKCSRKSYDRIMKAFQNLNDMLEKNKAD